MRWNSLAGLVVIPGNIAFLNQFFSVMLTVVNVAPDGSTLIVRDIEAEITLPEGQFEYDFDITWMRTDGTSVRRRGRDGSGLVFLDEPPPTDEIADAVGRR